MSTIITVLAVSAPWVVLWAFNLRTILRLQTELQEAKR